MSKQWDFQMRGERSAEVFIYNEIGEMYGFGAKQFAEKLSSLGDLDEIVVRMNSMGGSVFDGYTIHSLLKNHQAQVVVKIDGLAASIASLIAMAGDEVQISENGFFMIHEPWTVMMGTSRDLRAEADVLDKLMDQSVSAYANRTKLSEDEIRVMMVDTETWLNATEAVEKGFADSLMQPSKAAALTIDRSLFPNAPSQLKHRPVAEQAAEQVDQAAKEREAEAIAIRMRVLEVESI